jgi:malate dehydrogenase (oxaloacetate-decarboxylating)(NADP+)
VVVNGAGAAAIACARLFIAVGVRRENMVFCDSRGVVTTYRTDINEIKREFATTRRITTLAEALHDADVFLGVSKADTLTPEMLRTMSGNPIVMALANPDPEIAYDTAMLSRPDIIFAVRITRTRSTTCWGSPTSSGVRSTCGPRRSTRR